MLSRSGKRILILSFLMAGRVLTVHAAPGPQVPRNYAGDEACRACHAEIIDTYYKTAHKLTSRAPSVESILGSFAEHENILKTSNPNLHFRMESKPEGFYETAVSTLPGGGATEHTERIDIVIGSGRVGQTYLFWKGDLLFQLPVSYWTDLGTWVNSPGYRDGAAKFERPVVPRCLECHVTYAMPASPLASSNQYRADTLVLGISCERCHGPARDHVESMTRKTPGANIIPLAKLSRERQIEICAQCHGGRRFPQTAAFSYLPGEPLDKYYSRDQAKPAATVDVHGNQVALLQMSRCYQSSTNLVCSSCHDVHQRQRDAATFSARCLECHRPENCGEYARLKEKIVSGCVDCHMPVQASNLIISNSNGKQTRAMVRSHWIKIYGDSKRQKF
jgi:cytochrome c554/c'-like protein